MAEAQSLEGIYQTYKDQGLITISAWSEDNQGALPTTEVLKSWADQFGLTSPVVADPNSALTSVPCQRRRFMLTQEDTTPSGRHRGIGISILAFIVVPTWLHLSFQDPPKSISNRILEGNQDLVDLCINFGSILIAS